MSKSTKNALLARGLDSQKANFLSSQYTLSQLRQLPKDKLSSLGLDDNDINLILCKNNRPPIPPETVKKLLFKSKFTCCVCRNKDQPVIIHHIEEWHKSKDHSEDNLIVLCPNDHDRAHQKGGLTLQLTPKRLKELKNEWENICQQEDSYYLLSLSQNQYARWDWFNVKRIHELYKNQNMNLSQRKSFRILKRKKLLDLDGYLNLPKIKNLAGESHFTDWGDGFYVYDYLKEITNDIINNIRCINITSILKDKSMLARLVSKDNYIGFQGRFYFKPMDNNTKTAYYKANGVHISFVYDPYFCASCSSKHGSMTGNNVITVVGRVLDIFKDEDAILHIELSCLAAGSYFLNHDSREFTNSSQDIDEYDENILDDFW